jgi:hypothetical protein
MTESAESVERPDRNSTGHRQRGRAFYALLSLLSLAAIGLVLIGTRWGPALSYDSFTYITSARNLVAGLEFGEQSAGGYITPLAHFPPLLSLAIAGFEISGIDAVTGLRWLNAVLFGLTVATTGLALHWITRSYAFALFGAVLVLLSKVMIGVHAEAMSEGIYLWLGLLGLFLLAVFATSRIRWYLIGSAIAIGLAFLTRYIGLALVAAAVIGLLLNPRNSLRRRLSDAGLFLVISLAPMVIWGIRNYLTIGNITDRTAGWHPVGLDFIRAISNVVFIWFMPGRIVHGREPMIALALIAVVLVLTATLSRRVSLRRILRRWWHSAPIPTLGLLLSIYMATYLVMFLVSKSVFDPAIYVIDRLLSPLHFTMLILLVAGLAKVWNTESQTLRGLVVVFVIVFGGFYSYRAAQTEKYLYEEGLGYTSRAWHGSDAIAAVERLEGTKIYTNAVPAIYFWTGRTPYSMHGIEAVKQSLKEDCAVLVVFDSIELWLFGTTREEVSEGLQRLERDIADVYFHPQCSNELQTKLDY